jgi:Tol biopolymer transport system component
MTRVLVWLLVLAPLSAGTRTSSRGDARQTIVATSRRADGLLAFSAEGDIYAVRADGTALTRLTTDPAADFDPTWAPDGRHLAFRTARDGNDEIYVIDADGSHQRNLTHDPAADWSPAWSPDGTRLAYATFAFGGRSPGGPYTDIAVINPDGTGRKRLTTAHGEYPAWSPDGRQIAFTSGRAGSYDIWVMDADGTDQHPLTTDPAYESSATWAPDGTEIAFDAERGPGSDAETGIGPDFDLWVMRADGTGQAHLTTDPATEDRFPAWGPDGRLAFSRDGVLMLMDGDGRGLAPLPGPLHGQFAAWAPAPTTQAQVGRGG